jgi:magnesium transporter
MRLRRKKKKEEPKPVFYRREFTQAAKRGLPPGVIVHVGNKLIEKTIVSVIDYGEGHSNERIVSDVGEILSFREDSSVIWVNINGLHEPEVIEKIGAMFNIHPLYLEDIVDTSQRPKVEDAEDYLFLTLKMAEFRGETDEIVPQQISLILGKNFLITFQEKEGDPFDPIRTRIRAGKGVIRKSGVDYLAYCIVDALIDEYYTTIDKLSDRIESLELDLVKKPSTNSLSILHRLKTDLIFLRKAVWPMREVINVIAFGDSDLIPTTGKVYWRDVYDHTIHIMDTLDTLRDIVGGMLDVYLSSVSYRLNEVMKVLTIIATIFIPLTFIAGWYGMNFKAMPEIDWQYGYYWVIGLASISIGSMLFMYRRKGWI